MSTSPAEPIARIYAAFYARDVDAVLAMMHPDVDWPNGREGGRIVGRAAVRAYWTRQRAIEGITVEADGRVAVAVHQVVRDRAGTVLEENTVRHVRAVHDGLVTSREIRGARG